MITTTLLLLIPAVEVTRVLEDRLAERSALVLPLSARQLDGRMSFGFNAGRNFADPARAATPMSMSMSLGFWGTSFRITLPWVAAAGPTFQSPRLGNVGLGLHISLYEASDLRIGVLVEFWGGTSDRSAARALAFGFDLPRYAPRVHTASLGGSLTWRGHRLIAGANAGADAHIFADPYGPNHTNGSLWGELWLGAPIELGDLRPWRVWISPLFEANGRSLFSWNGSANDVAITAGGTVTFGTRGYSADNDFFGRFAISAGYQTTVLTSSERAGRLIVALDVAWFISRAEWSEALR